MSIADGTPISDAEKALLKRGLAKFQIMDRHTLINRRELPLGRAYHQERHERELGHELMQHLDVAESPLVVFSLGSTERDYDGELVEISTTLEFVPLAEVV